MAQFYYTATSYVSATRTLLQDFVEPYRYTDQQIVDAMNRGLDELGRLRPDMWLDLKYQHPVKKGDIDDGTPGPYSLSDISVTNGVYNTTQGTPIPLPNKYRVALEWFMPGWLQLFDVTDTQDQRAQAFLTKFQGHLLQLGAA
jgi:hypothetical protein